MSRNLLLTGFVTGLAVLLLVFAYTQTAESSHTTSGNTIGWLWGGSTHESIGCTTPPCPPTTQNATGVGWVSVDASNPITGFAHNQNSGSYGVTIPQTDGPLVGNNNFIWSSNVGWIDLGPAPDTIRYPGCGYPGAPCGFAGPVRRAGDTLVGWARILGIKEALNQPNNFANNNSGGWEGWIKFSNSYSGGVSIVPNSSLPAPYTHALNGYAWSNELGWIKFGPPNLPYPIVNLGNLPPVQLTPTCALFASPNIGTAPLSGTLTWTTASNPTSCTISGGPINPAGPFNPATTPSAAYGPINATTGYTMACSNTFGLGTPCGATVTISGSQPPQIGPVDVTCSGSPNPSFLNTGGLVTWKADITGGAPTGINWSFPGGNPPNASGSSMANVSYDTIGIKSAQVTVISGAYSDTASCSVTVKRFKIIEKIPLF